MRVVLQRVSRARVTVGDREVGAVEQGFLVLAGVAETDEDADLDLVADKIGRLRVFNDDEGKMNLSLRDVGGRLLVVSQFTLHADCRKGRRPSFAQAAAPERAREMFDRFVDKLRDRGASTETGEFGAMMDVELVNAGPVTIILDSDDLKRPRNAAS